ncbi:hypothetical protein [Pelagibius marinus]|uniref:hypothetical protein n=1 Tax=Pelagibius marinus TaxID=2762760 RepID=UPI001872A0A7|nr:hypothetical protein [Pelagibius marinus]
MQRLRIIYYSLLFFITALAITSIANAETIIVPNQNLDVVIDVDACDIAGHVLCGGTGSSGAAAVGNDSIVVVFVYARTANGLPITGLAEGDFSFTALQNPGGISLVFVQSGVCPACFAEFPDGVYRFALRPVSGNWDDGTYIQALQVTSGANTRQVVVPVQVPN